ncbi:MAG: RDD family protein [Bacteroidetes bacterium]|jgi:uncharacterized RDD family membrane protein YckC|nr:RDD family protein [Bacteroidota bacterium]
MNATGGVSYAGFWRRFVASIIDGIIIGIAQFVVFLPALAVLGIGVATTAMEEEPSTGVGLILMAVGAYFFAILLSVIMSWLYFALMESSSRGATLGKMALGIRVTDLSGNRISFGKATGRYFGKIVSSMILMIGYLMAAFTEKKQALHDMMAGCLVVND